MQPLDLLPHNQNPSSCAHMKISITDSLEDFDRTAELKNVPLQGEEDSGGPEPSRGLEDQV